MTLSLDLAPEGLDHELDFWRGFVTTPRFLIGWCGDKPTPELQPLVRDFLFERPEARVLDVGSGVVSILHGTARYLIAADPLADRYKQIFDYNAHGLVPPLAAPVEDLRLSGFDVVHMSNALDHCQNPLLGMQGLMSAAKPGGWVIVQSNENEGSNQRWAGMHQWNLRLSGRQLICHSRNGVALKLGLADKVATYDFDARRWFVWMRLKL